VPIGAHAHFSDGRLKLIGVVIAPGGTQFVRAELEGPAEEAAALGREAGARLLAEGGREILDAVYGEPRDPAV
jgi:hydroxymethylbilane synthase